MKFLPIDLSSFKDIIEGNYLYVDKTRHIYDLYSKGGRYYFLARPRRFGKTLLLSTLKELFSGNRKLFKGLWINSSDYVWKEHPVISLDFSGMDKSSPEKFRKSLEYHLDRKGKQFSIDLSLAKNPSDKLVTLVEELAQKNKVVILIDEYDNPLINNMSDPELMEEYRKILRDFFDTVKSLDSYLRALFITGVSQIPKTSIFSGLNSPNNISFDPLASSLLGYTKEEITANFSDSIKELAQIEQKSPEVLELEIQQWYNGYRFSKKEETVYNPFSIHYLFTKKEFTNYWFRSGTPSFLICLLKKYDLLLDNPEGLTASEDTLGTLYPEDPDLAPLLFQTGYLTITDYNKERKRYTLSHPNQEVRQSYNLALLLVLSGKKDNELDDLVERLREALLTNDMKRFCSVVTSLLSGIPYFIDAKKEAAYHRLLQIALKLAGFKVASEVATNKGRIDMVVYTPQFIYIFELKVRSSSQTALAQIEDSTYYEPFIEDNRTLILVGLSFGKEEGKPTIQYSSKVLSKDQ